jgi:DNA (cytosine-5)-methyltransferase 1
LASYYNEINPYAAQWLRNLIAAGHIAPGDVDERSIADVRADDLASYSQCHFFAGIGGWSLALRLAGWPDDRPIWTGSCPCQPFSAAGKGAAADDERHLWPDWFRLIRVARPPILFGEQVEAAIGWGWLDLVHADLGSQGYATGFAVLPACGVGAPHIRQRLWFVAQSGGAERGSRRPERNGADGGRPYGEPAGSGVAGLVAHHDGGGQLVAAGSLAEPQHYGLQGPLRPELRSIPAGQHQPLGRSGAWDDLEWLPCTDGKARPTKPGLFPLAAGLSARVGKLRAAGNAIVPQCAAEFIRAATGG